MPGAGGAFAVPVLAARAGEVPFVGSDESVAATVEAGLRSPFTPALVAALVPLLPALVDRRWVRDGEMCFGESAPGAGIGSVAAVAG